MAYKHHRLSRQSCRSEHGKSREKMMFAMQIKSSGFSYICKNIIGKDLKARSSRTIPIFNIGIKFDFFLLYAFCDFAT
jgi:hypothetical protein